MIGAAMKSKGFWDDGTGPLDGTLFRLSLAQTEVCEAMQEVKRHWGRVNADQEVVKDDVAEEWADAAIRLYDCAAFGVFDLDGRTTLYDVLDVGPNERAKTVIRCGKVTALIGDAFGLVEDEVEDGRDGMTLMNRIMVAEFLFTAIRHLDRMCKAIGRDLNAAIDAKMAENMKRPDRYGTPDEGKG